MTRRKFSLITAVRLSAFLLGGCSKPDYEWVMKIQDKDIPAGIYVMSEMLAYMQENTAADSTAAASGATFQKAASTGNASEALSTPRATTDSSPPKSRKCRMTNHGRPTTAMSAVKLMIL